MLNDDRWQDFREQFLSIAQERNDSIVKEFLDKAKYKGSVGYYINHSKRTVEIYAKSPGILIGRAGRNVYEFQNRLSEEYGGEWHVNFTEVRGGFVNNSE